MDDEECDDSDGARSPRRNDGAGRRIDPREAGDKVAADMQDDIMDTLFDEQMVKSGYYDSNELEAAGVSMEDSDSEEATLEHTPETRAALGRRSSPHRTSTRTRALPAVSLHAPCSVGCFSPGCVAAVLCGTLNRA